MKMYSWNRLRIVKSVLWFGVDIPFYLEDSVMAKVQMNLKVDVDEKSEWMKAAGGEDLSSWMRDACNVAAAAINDPAPVMAEQEATASVEGMATKAKQVQYPDMSILVDQQRRVKTYYERLEAYGVRFDWSKCTYAKERGRCAKLRVAICEACQG